MAGELSIAGKFRRTMMRLPLHALKGTMVRDAIAHGLRSKTLLPEEIQNAEAAIELRRPLDLEAQISDPNTQKRTDDPKPIIDIISKNIPPKHTAIVLFDPMLEMVPPMAQLFDELYIVETNESVRTVIRGMLFHLGLDNITCSGRYPDRGIYNTIFVGNPNNRNLISWPMVPVGALLIYRGLPADKFAQMSNSGFSLVYPYNTGALDTSPICIIKRDRE